MTMRKAQTAAASTYSAIATRKIIECSKWGNLASKPVVLTKGTFDILHTGHLALFSFCGHKAERLGADAIVAVIVETDESVRARKGMERPYQNQLQRALQIALLDNVDAVLLAAKSELPGAIGTVKPRVYVKGMDTAGLDQSSETQSFVIDIDLNKNPELNVVDDACEVVIFTDDGSVSTTSLVRKIVENR